LGTRSLGPAGITIAPERLAQLFSTLCFADTSVGQQASIQTSQLVAAGDAALPQHHVGEHTQWSEGWSGCSAGFEEQVGTCGAFHGVHPSACGGFNEWFVWDE
jgi:hypothetical protein